jgi:hypothetical protein
MTNIVFPLEDKGSSLTKLQGGIGKNPDNSERALRLCICKPWDIIKHIASLILIVL